MPSIMIYFLKTVWYYCGKKKKTIFTYNTVTNILVLTSHNHLSLNPTRGSGPLNRIYTRSPVFLYWLRSLGSSHKPKESLFFAKLFGRQGSWNRSIGVQIKEDIENYYNYSEFSYGPLLQEKISMILLLNNIPTISRMYSGLYA